MSCATTWWDGSSHVIEIAELRNGATGELVTAGVAVGAVVVVAGTSEQEATATLTHAGGGTWRGVFSSGVALSEAVDYEVVVTANGGEFFTRRWRLPFTVRGVPVAGS